jgi:hypothetical protein
VILSGRFWSQLIKTHQPISGKKYQQQFTRPVSLKSVRSAQLVRCGQQDELRRKFTVFIHECQFPRADAGAHAGGGCWLV